MMYKYLVNKNSQAVIDEKTKLQIAEKLQKNRIYSDFIGFSSEKELAEIFSQTNKQSTNTIVLIGDDNDFSMFIGQIGKLDGEVAIGYLPISKSSLAKKLKIGSTQESIDALAQRKIIEKTIYSISSRYFLDEIELFFSDYKKGEKLTIVTDKNLELSLPKCTIRLENLNDDSFLEKTPIQLSAYLKEENIVADKKDSILKKIKSKITTSSKENSGQKLILSLHAKSFKIGAGDNLIDPLGRKYNQTLVIGKSPKNIRLISKRPDLQK